MGRANLLVASTGGHLSELIRLRPRLDGLNGEVLWATFDTEQSRSLLANERVVFVSFTAPRDWRAVLANIPVATRILRRHRIDRVISTGSGVALSFLPVARAMGIECHYIESAARNIGPSLTGRIVRRLPAMHLYTQYPAWAEPPWGYGGSVFDSFRVIERGAQRPPRRILVALGTNPYEFPRLIDRVREIVPDGVEVFWQTGATQVDVASLPGVVRPMMPVHELDDVLRNADAVIAHAGFGTAMAALEAGLCPILVPRDASFGEHVDDHQRQIADELAGRGLALMRRVGELTAEDLVIAAGTQIMTDDQPPSFPLDTGGRGRAKQS